MVRRRRGAADPGNRPRRSPLSRVLLAAGVIAAAAALLWMGAGGEVTSSPGPAAPILHPAAMPPTPPPPAAGAEAPPRARPLVPAPEELPEPIRRYLEAHPYPPTSGRLTRAHEDLLAPNRRHERFRPIPDSLDHDPDAIVEALFTADRFYYTGSEVVHASLRVRRAGEPVEVEVLEAEALAEGRSGPEGPSAPLHFRPAGDGLVAELDLSRFGDHFGPVLLRVRFDYGGKAPAGESLRIYTTPRTRIPAELTGEVGSRVVDGNLLLEAGVVVRTEGFYRFDANLYDARGEPVAFATFKGHLPRGPGVVPLEIYGKVLRDAGRPGPYTVAQLRGYRFLDGSWPDRERLPDHPGTWVTEAFPLEAFRDEPHMDEHKARMVALMLEDVARGIALDVPPLPAPGETPGPKPPDDDLEPTAEADEAVAPEAAPAPAEADGPEAS